MVVFLPLKMGRTCGWQAIFTLGAALHHVCVSYLEHFLGLQSLKLSLVPPGI